jgi:uncharacterized paraquat-inducible protein A
MAAVAAALDRSVAWHADWCIASAELGQRCQQGKLAQAQNSLKHITALLLDAMILFNPANPTEDVM